MYRFIVGLLLLVSTLLGAQERGPQIEVDPAFIIDGPATVRSVKEALLNSLRRVEVYYNTSDNEQVLHEIGLSGKFVLADCRVTIINCPKDGTVEYTRVGAVDVSAQVVTGAGGESKVQLNKANISILEYMTKNGTYINLVRLGFMKNNRTKYLDYILPMALVTAAQNIDIKLDKSGVLKIFVQGHAELGLNHGKYSSNNNHIDEGKFSSIYYQVGGQVGLKVANTLSLIGLGRYHNDWGGTIHSMQEGEYGGRVKLDLFERVNIYVDGTKTYRSVNRKLDTAAPTMQESKENYWYAGAGLQVEF